MNLDLDTLRTFSAAHDLGGLAQAAERLGRTPSAISLQMKRLQDDVGVALFRKRGRGLALTEAGEVALQYARRILALNDELLETMQGASVAGHIRIGCTMDLSSMLPAVLSRFTALYPQMQVELRIEGNAALAEATERSQIDLSVVLGHEERAAATKVGEVELVWISAENYVPQTGQALPLAALGPRCIFRRRAIEQLDEKAMAYRIAANSPSLDGLWLALLGGLGVTARTALNLPQGLVWGRSLHDLPALGTLPVTLHRSAASSGVAMDRMASLLADGLVGLLSSAKTEVMKNASMKTVAKSAAKTRHLMYDATNESTLQQRMHS
ncbi:MAG: LysR substrate-binding domain-containing protein [Edaphobacter sp.]|uniref:LysR family transcriptional regulator n=1 Tax=Edaphobacter sp. TaxID=1934404 RepID=UPI00238E85B8|nr:LysR family transcriptional regulator [Edaphobacter sp.]MDE1175902.1 LysR substrate-binding domain-containing protein [Edaphobacter sp.]